MLDLHDRLHFEASVLADQRQVPEAVSVPVLTLDFDTAVAVAPMLAARLYPTRRFGRVLHAEVYDDRYVCDVEVLP